METQIYLFPNKPDLQDNDLFLISNEYSSNHKIENSKASQIKSVLFQRAIGVYTPAYTNPVGMTIVNTTENNVYLSYNKNIGNWVLVTIVYQLLPTIRAPTVDVSIPFGGNFSDVNDAIGCGCSQGYNLSPPMTFNVGSASLPVQRIEAVIGTNTVKVTHFVSNVWLNAPRYLSVCFSYLIR